MSHRARSGEVERFGLYLRYGFVFPETAEERKFNPYHDPDDAPGGGALPPRAHSPSNAAMTARVQREMAVAGPSYNGPRRNSRPQQAKPPAKSKYPSALAAKYESGGQGDPGTISSVPNDPGGRSYGKVQFASRSKMIVAFLASPEASRWAPEFRGLKPVTP